MKRKVIAVTGGIGSGKSTVCRLLEKKGFRVVDCDALSRRVAEQSETLEEIKRVFGKRFVADGSLDRRALAREVFSDKNTPPCTPTKKLYTNKDHAIPAKVFAWSFL